MPLKNTQKRIEKQQQQWNIKYQETMGMIACKNKCNGESKKKTLSFFSFSSG